MVVPGSFGEWLSTLIPAGGIGLSNALLYKMISFDFLYAGGHAFFQADVLLASTTMIHGRELRTQKFIRCSFLCIR